MEAPTTTNEIKAAYRRLYCATAIALSTAHDMTIAKSALKDAEMPLILSDAVKAGKNADDRAAILFGLTAVERDELRQAEGAYAAADMERTLAQITVNELRELLRLAEWDNTSYYRED